MKNAETTMQTYHSEESEDNSAVPVKKITLRLFLEVTALINKRCQIFCSKGPNWEQSSTIKRGL
jgi:hypothetical protein